MARIDLHSDPCALALRKWCIKFVFFWPPVECRGTMRLGPAKQKLVMEKMISVQEGRGSPLFGSLSLLHKEPFLPSRLY